MFQTPSPVHFMGAVYSAARNRKKAQTCTHCGGPMTALRNPYGVPTCAHKPLEECS